MSIDNVYNQKSGQYVDSQGAPLGNDPSIFLTQTTDNQETPLPSGINSLLNIKQAQSGTPAYTPKSFSDQFYFKSDGTLWVYINNVWVQTGAGNTIQTIGTSLPSASTYSGQYYYLTTTDTLYRSNGTAWISLN
jgi:hypothetical protein